MLHNTSIRLSKQEKKWLASFGRPVGEQIRIHNRLVRKLYQLAEKNKTITLAEALSILTSDPLEESDAE